MSILKFVLDVHLAKLARHLRMIGVDSLWKSDFEDDELVRIAADETRVLLTRDRVPEHVLSEHQDFFLCPRCERVYWNGSHVDRMKEWLMRLPQG